MLRVCAETSKRFSFRQPYHIFKICFVHIFPQWTVWNDLKLDSLCRVHPCLLTDIFIPDDNQNAVDDLHCRQLRAGAGTTECAWTGSSQVGEWSVFIWDNFGELFAQMTTSEPSLEFEMPVATFGKHFTVQIGQRTIELVLHGWFAVIISFQILNFRQIKDVRLKWKNCLYFRFCYLLIEPYF